MGNQQGTLKSFIHSKISDANRLIVTRWCDTDGTFVFGMHDDFFVDTSETRRETPQARGDDIVQTPKAFSLVKET